MYTNRPVFLGLSYMTLEESVMTFLTLPTQHHVKQYGYISNMEFEYSHLGPLGLMSISHSPQFSH